MLAIRVRSNCLELVRKPSLQIISIWKLSSIAQHSYWAVFEKKNVLLSIILHQEIEDFLAHRDYTALLCLSTKQVFRYTRSAVDKFCSTENHLKHFLKRSHVLFFLCNFDHLEITSLIIIELIIFDRSLSCSRFLK